MILYMGAKCPDQELSSSPCDVNLCRYALLSGLSRAFEALGDDLHHRLSLHVAKSQDGPLHVHKIGHTCLRWGKRL